MVLFLLADKVDAHDDSPSNIFENGMIKRE